MGPPSWTGSDVKNAKVGPILLLKLLYGDISLPDATSNDKVYIFGYASLFLSLVTFSHILQML